MADDGATARQHGAEVFDAAVVYAEVGGNAPLTPVVATAERQGGTAAVADVPPEVPRAGEAAAAVVAVAG